MITYYWYISSLLFLGLVNVGTKGLTPFLKVTASIIIITIIGFRYEVGVDWLLYRDFFNGSTITLTLEPGYQLISILLSLTGISYWVFVFGITLLSVVVLNKFFKELSYYPVFALGCYFALSPVFNIEAIRQILAVTFFYIGLVYFINNKRKIYYIYALIATICHISAILMFILPFMIKSKNIKFYKYLLLPGFVLALVGFYPIEILINLISLVIHNSYTEKLLSYTTPANISPVITFSLAFKLIILLSYYYRKEHLIKKDALNAGHLIVEKIIIFMIFLDVYIGRFGTISSRLDEYFLPAFVCMATLVIYSFGRYLNRIVFTLFIISYLMVSFYRLSQDDYFKDQFLPYQNYLLISNDGSHRFDKTREKAVDYHWKNRDK